MVWSAFATILARIHRVGFRRAIPSLNPSGAVSKQQERMRNQWDLKKSSCYATPRNRRSRAIQTFQVPAGSGLKGSLPFSPRRSESPTLLSLLLRTERVYVRT